MKIKQIFVGGEMWHKAQSTMCRVPVPTKRMEVADAESLLQLSCSTALTVQVVADSKNAGDVLLQT